MTTIRWLLLVLVLVPASASAQGIGFTQRTNEPVTIEADDGVEWRQNEQVYVAHGNATASQSGRTIRADTLTAHYRPQEGGQNKIWKIVADGNVVITTEDGERITAQQAVYLIDETLFTLTGNNLRMESEERVITARDRITYNSTERVATVEGDAYAEEGDRKVWADRFVAYMAEGEEGNNRMRRVEAHGNVVIRRPGEVARGNQGTYDTEAQIATLTGNVRLTRGESQINGERAEVNFRTGVSRLLAGGDGRVRGIFTPREGDPIGTGRESESDQNQDTQ